MEHGLNEQQKLYIQRHAQSGLHIRFCSSYGKLRITLSAATGPLSVAILLALNFVVRMEILELSCPFGHLNANNFQIDG